MLIISRTTWLTLFPSLNFRQILFYLFVIELQQSFGSSQGLLWFALASEVDNLFVQIAAVFHLSPELVVVAGTVRRADDVPGDIQLDFVKLFLDLRVEAEELGVADGYLFSG